jgi:protoheme IX farnesyltransferase
MGVARYLPLFKLRICGLITFSAIAGLFAASSGGFAFGRMALLAASIMLASAAASAFNQYFDSDIDAVMARTRKRPFPSGQISSRMVLAVATGLFALSLAVSLLALNYMVALHLALGAFVYAVVYTVWLKRRSWTNIIVGGLAGSFAVLAGGASASPGLCAPPVLFAIIMFLWTPSHFWSFAIYHREDYARAGVPMLPVVIGEKRTARYTLVNTTLLVASSLAPWFMGFSGPIYLGAAAVMGAYFIYWNIRLVRDPVREVAWKNFRVSMVYLGVLFASVIIDMTMKNVL